MTSEGGKVGKIEMIKSYVLVAAMDVGTSASGYALSFKTDPDTIRMNKNWGESQSCSSYKTPTCILTEKGTSGKYVDFGYNAEETYRNALAGEDANRYDFYHNFKMILYTEKKLDNRTMVTSDKGTKRPLMDIFTMIIQALKDHLLQQSLNNVQARVNDIRWVITIPAIWSDKAKQFMINAAEKAGLHPSLTILTLEPEAASIYCRQLGFNNFERATELYFEESDLSFSPGIKYLLIDAGGGTVDITAHEILDDGRIGELHSATGGYWGGSTINDNFVQLLCDIMGSNFIEKFKEECPVQWYEVNMEFESKKRSAKPDSSLNISLSAALERKYRKWEKQDLDDTINSRSDLGVSESNGILILNKDAVRRLFEPVTSQVISHITNIMKSEKLKNINYFFLVGGFGACSRLQRALQDFFKGKQPVLIPNEAQIAIIRGAVMFGHNPSIIKILKAQRTYGVSTMVSFDGKVHKKNKRVSYDGHNYCKDIFLPFIVKGDDVEINQSGKTLVSPVSESITVVNVKFLSLDRSILAGETLYVDSPGVEEVGTIPVHIPTSDIGKERNAELEIIFSGRVIYCKAHNLSTGDVTSIEINFMST